MDSSPLIAERLDISKILKKASKDWDGGFTIAGMIGHGDAFVLRDPCGLDQLFILTTMNLLLLPPKDQ